MSAIKVIELISLDPLVDSASAPQLARIYEGIKNDDSNEAYCLALCLSLRLLSTHVPEDLSSQQPPPDSRHPRQRLIFLLNQSMIKLSEFDINCKGGLLQQRYRSRAVVGAGVLAVLLRETFHTRHVYPGWGHYRPHRDLPGNRAAIVIPDVHDTVFHSLVELPLPFTPQTAGELGTSHLTKTAISEYLVNGKWNGIYTKSFDIHQPGTFDPPMENIQFTATQGPDLPSVLEFDARGKDAIGRFKLHGRMNQCSGAILAKKTYPSHSFEWSCLMTPLGIVGSWGTPPWGGWVWLWKVPESSGSNKPQDDD